MPRRTRFTSGGFLRSAVFLGILFCCQTTVSLPAQQVQPPSFKSSVELVTVDVTVLGADDNPLLTLAADDFMVAVDGKPRKVASLRLVKAGAPATSVAEARRPEEGRAVGAPTPVLVAGRIFVFVVDRLHIGAGQGMQMIEAASRFIDALPAGDRVGVCSIPSSSSSFRLVDDRETSKAALRQLVGQYRPLSGTYAIGDEEALAIENGQLSVLESVVARECAATGETTPALLPQCRQRLATEARAKANDVTRRTEDTLRSLNDVIRALQSIEGPKHLVLITGRPALTTDAWSLLKDAGAAAGAARTTVHAVQLDEQAAIRGDVRQAAVEHDDQLGTTATALAATTGGLWMTPAVPSLAFTRLARELSASYLLGVEAEASDHDGRPHAITVRLRPGIEAAQVRARQTFRIAASLPLTSVAGPASTPPAAATGSASVNATAEAQAPAPVTADRDRPRKGADTSQLVAMIASYAGRFEREFSAVVTEERYVQTIHPWRGVPKGPETEPALAWLDDKDGKASSGGGPITSRRQILSDLLLVQIQGGQWVGYRDVAIVDHRPVRDRAERVRELFLSKASDRDTQLRRITDESARYNLGDTRRTFNLPTVTLSFLRKSDIWRFKFKMEKDEIIDGRRCRVLSFSETGRPTLIGTAARGSEIPIDGRVWVDEERGVVVRTEMRCDPSPLLRLCVQVDFSAAPGIAVLVPSRMWEWYDISQGMSEAKPGGKWGEGANPMGISGGAHRLIECLATYANFRQFQVTTTEDIKAP